MQPVCYKIVWSLFDLFWFDQKKYDTVSRSEKFAIQRGQKIHHQNSLKLYINVVRHDLGIIKKKELMQNCDFFDS